MTRSFTQVSGLAVAALAFAGTAAAATTFNVNFDRWNYPFAGNGSLPTAAAFGAVGIPFQFDDMDAQFLNSFVTAAGPTGIAAGQGASNYVINSATFTANIIGGSFTYSDTYAPGQSIELYGTGFRGGFNAFAYNDAGPFGFGAPTDEGIRNAFATDNAGGSLRDVSNFVRDALTVSPFAIGQIAGLTSGDNFSVDPQQLFVPVTFELDLNNADVVSYLQQSLDAGIVSLTVGGTHAAVQGGPVTYPQYATNEFFFPGLGATLELDVAVVPAPGAAGLLAVGGVAATRRRRG